MQQAPLIQVVIVEDSARIRESLSALINDSPGYAVQAVYPNAEIALAKIPSNPPDVVLMDIGLPRMSGIECVRALKSVLPALPILMLTVYDEGPFLFNSLKAGANGYLLKRTTAEKLLEAIQEVRLGGIPLTRQMAGKVATYFQELGTITKEISTLTRREHETLALLSEGFFYKEIADKLSLSIDTVREYIRNIYTKLHVNSRTEAVVKYLNQ